MGKNLTTQKRGKGSSTYRAPSFRYVAEARHRSIPEGEKVSGKVVDIVDCPGHYAPLAVIKYDDGCTATNIACAGIRVGDPVEEGKSAEVREGNTLPLDNIPAGTLVFNIEAKPGDGGKFVRSSGGYARVVSKNPGEITVILPSKKKRVFVPECRAIIGVAAGSGRTEKPLMKAGKNYFKKKAMNKYYPHVSGLAMGAVAHPYGGSRSSKLGKVAIAPRFAPAGRKVGLLHPRRSGRGRKEVQ